MKRITASKWYLRGLTISLTIFYFYFLFPKQFYENVENIPIDSFLITGIKYSRGIDHDTLFVIKK